MTDPTKELLEEQLAAWNAAQLATASGKSYQLGSMMLTRSDSVEIKNKISEIRRQLIDLDTAARGGRQGIRRPVWS